jgi:hypothetical protein
MNRPRIGSRCDRVEYRYNRQGQQIEVTDQNQTVHDYVFDNLGRQTEDCVSSFGTGVDDTVKRIERQYEVRGMVASTKSYDNATVGAGNVMVFIPPGYETGDNQGSGITECIIKHEQQHKTDFDQDFPYLCKCGGGGKNNGKWSELAYDTPCERAKYENSAYSVEIACLEAKLKYWREEMQKDWIPAGYPELIQQRITRLKASIAEINRLCEQYKVQMEHQRCRPPSIPNIIIVIPDMPVPMPTPYIPRPL